MYYPYCGANIYQTGNGMWTVDDGYAKIPFNTYDAAIAFIDGE